MQTPFLLFICNYETASLLVLKNKFITNILIDGDLRDIFLTNENVFKSQISKG
jgi:hypothetical protein